MVPSSPAQTPVIFPIREMTGSSTPYNPLITITPLNGPISYSNQIFYSGPITVQPTNGVAQTNLMIGNYRVTFAGLSKALTVFVPNTTNLVNLASASNQVSGITQVFYVPASTNATVSGAQTNNPNIWTAAQTFANGVDATNLETYGTTTLGSGQVISADPHHWLWTDGSEESIEFNTTNGTIDISASGYGAINFWDAPVNFYGVANFLGPSGIQYSNPSTGKKMMVDSGANLSASTLAGDGAGVSNTIAKAVQGGTGPGYLALGPNPSQTNIYADGPSGNVTAAGVIAAAGFSGSASNLTSLPATNLVGLIPNQWTPLLWSTFAGTTLPANMFFNGTWSVNNGLFVSGAALGIGTVCQFTNRSDIDNIDITWDFTPTNTSTLAGALKQPLVANGLPGDVFYADWTGNTICIASTTDNINHTVMAGAPIPAAVAGRKYKFQYHKTDSGYARLDWWDSVTGSNVFCISQTGETINSADNVGVFCGVGGGVFGSLVYSTRHPRNPKLLILGDSYSEGDSLGGPRNSRWCALARDWLGGNCAICAQGGESTVSILNRLPTDLMSFRPQNVLVQLQNDLALSGTVPIAYATNISNIVGQIKSIGAVPILGTFTMPTLTSTYASRSNAYWQSTQWVLTNAGPMGCRIFDLNKAVVLGGTNLNPAFDNGDGLHPNVAGHLAMFNELQKDLPDVLGTQAATWNNAEASDPNANAWIFPDGSSMSTNGFGFNGPVGMTNGLTVTGSLKVNGTVNVAGAIHSMANGDYMTVECTNSSGSIASFLRGWVGGQNGFSLTADSGAAYLQAVSGELDLLGGGNTGIHITAAGNSTSDGTITAPMFYVNTVPYGEFAMLLQPTNGLAGKGGFSWIDTTPFFVEITNSAGSIASFLRGYVGGQNGFSLVADSGAAYLHAVSGELDLLGGGNTGIHITAAGNSTSDGTITAPKVIATNSFWGNAVGLTNLPASGISGGANGQTLVSSNGVAVFSNNGGGLTNLLPSGIASGTATNLSVYGSNIFGCIITNLYTNAGTFTWYMPTNCMFVHVVAIGSGGGGGSGGNTNSGTAIYGGGGGGGGVGNAGDILAGAIGPPGTAVTVVVGAGGSGGAANTTPGNPGHAGGNGSADSAFGTLVTGPFGLGGAAGSTGNGTGGSVQTIGLGSFSTGGSSSISAAASIGATSSYVQGSGGGGGGGVSASPLAYAGGGGGANLVPCSMSVAPGGATNITTTATVGNSRNPLLIGGGIGGAGSGGCTTVASGQGGNGGYPGGGGGGSGATIGANNSGAGGSGANGMVLVISYISQ